MGKKVTLKETIQYIKDRTECFVDDIFCVLKKLRIINPN